MLSKSDVGAYEYTDPRHPYAATKAGSVSYAYDQNGNMVSDGTAMYVYDYANRLSTVTATNGMTTYIYDDTTNRIQKRLSNGGRLSYVGSEAEVDEAGRTTDYIFANNDRILTIDPNEGVLYNIEDHLSSASLVVKGGTIVQKLDYYPYGTERVNEKTTAFGARHTFTDKELDPESSLQYFGARYYDPTIGRFTQIDPLEGNTFDPQSLNRYAYSRNNPLRYIDPTGQSFDDVVNDLGKSYADLYSRTGALAVGIPVFLARNPLEAGKIGITLLPVVGESIDSYEISSGKDFFDGSSVSGERRALTVAGLASGFGSGRLARESGKDLRKSLDEFSDDAIVVRGGNAKNFTAERFGESIQPSRIPGVVGFSVQCNGCTDLGVALKDLARFLKNKEIGITTTGEIRRAGGNVVTTPGVGAHATASSLDNKTASKVPWKFFTNPNPYKRGK